MNIYARLLATTFAVFFVSGATAEVTVIAGDVLATRIIYGTQPVIVDVRTPGEYEAGHVPGAVNIPHGFIAERHAEMGVPKDAELIVYCRSGKRAGIAEEALLRAGYTNVVDMSGHWLGWDEAGLASESAPE